MTTHLAATWHTLTYHAHQYAQQASGGRRDRGDVTIQQVLWAVFAIALVGIVVAAIRSYVTTQAANIR